jgi:hypothetical protein
MDKKITFSPAIDGAAIFSFSKFAYLCFLVYVGMLLAFGDYMGLVPIAIGGIQFYGADILIILLLLTIIPYGFAFLFNTRLSFLLMVAIAFGVISLVYAIGYGQSLRDIFGAFRRLFFYMLAFQVTWQLLNRPNRVTKIYSLIHLAIVPVISISLFRLWKGISWSTIFAEADFRPVSLVSATILLWVFYDAVTNLLFARERVALAKSLLWFVISGFTLFISNYRLLWITPLLGVGGILWFLWQRGYIKIEKFLRAGFLVIIGILITIALLKLTHSGFYAQIEQKFIEQVLGFQFVGSFRYYVWREAWARLQTNWLIGVGIGDRLVYPIRNSLGDWVTSTSTTHNILLEVLYQTGILGFFSFILPHLFFITYTWKHLHHLSQQWVRPVFILFSTYISVFIIGIFEPFLTFPNVAVLLYVVMGITMRSIFWDKHYLAEEKIRENRIT